MRKGYYAEKIIKDGLIKKYGYNNVIKVAIGGAEDFLILKKGRVIGVVEVKETKNKKYYPKPKEKKQFERIKKFAREHKCFATLFIVYRRGKGSKNIIEEREL